jgi:hypothetical protein
MSEWEMNALDNLKGEVELTIKALLKNPRFVRRAHRLESALRDLEAATKEADGE